MEAILVASLVVFLWVASAALFMLTVSVMRDL